MRGLVLILFICFTFQFNKSEPNNGTVHNGTLPIPNPQPTVPIPAPQPTVPIPTPQPTVPIPAPQPTVPIPAPQPTVPIPAPQPTVPIPTPQPTVPIPTPQPTVPIPTPLQPKPSPAPTNQTVPLPSPPPENPVWHWVELGLHIALIVVGVVWLLVGYRILRVVLFVGGFIVFFFISFELLETLVVAKGTLAEWIAYVISAGIGLIGGCVFVVLVKFGVFLFGTLLGILFSSLVMSSTPLATLSISPMIQLVVLLCSGVLLGIVSVIFERPICIIGTAFNGSYLIFSTIDTEWIHSGASDLLTHIFHDFNSPISFDIGNWKAYLILAAIFILAIFGIIIQFRWTAGEHKKKPKEEQPLLNSPHV